MFGKSNYIWMAAGIALLALGMFLLSGGRSNVNPAVFDEKEVYSTTRITVAPVLIILGLVVEIYAIFSRPKQNAA